jgi:hypothetical protein
MMSFNAEFNNRKVLGAKKLIFPVAFCMLVGATYMLLVVQGGGGSKEGGGMEPQYLLWFFLYCIYTTVEISNGYDLIRGCIMNQDRTKTLVINTHNILESIITNYLFS